nr:MAG TPA: hypothetical protein [Bacteriophage sp.]
MTIRIIFCMIVLNQKNNLTDVDLLPLRSMIRQVRTAPQFFTKIPTRHRMRVKSFSVAFLIYRSRNEEGGADHGK